jgi:hypothetical protein
MVPAPARWDGEPTTVGFFPCECSREAWSESDEHWEGGLNYEEYLDFRGYWWRRMTVEKK